MKDLFLKIKEWFLKIKDNLKSLYYRLSSEDRAGLYVTVIFHLTVIIVLLIIQIGTFLGGETSFVLDFSKQEAAEKAVQEQEFKEDISKRLDDLLKIAASLPDDQSVRNVIVDRASLKDDRNTNAEELYKEAEQLENQLKSGSNQALMEDARQETVDYSSTKNDKPEAEYKGPSVVSYTLDGRKASRMKIPAYRCYGGGMVTVVITVDPQGNVINAKINETVSSEDACLRDFAIRAARLSKFSTLPQDRLKKDPSLGRQLGEIVYSFIAQ